MAAIIAKATAVAAVAVAAVASLIAQLSNSAATTSGAAVLAGLTVSAIALIRFLIVRSTTDEGRSTEMWTDIRSERDEARARASRAFKTLEVVRDELAVERAQRIRCETVMRQLVAEFRVRVGEEPSTTLD